MPLTLPCCLDFLPKTIKALAVNEPNMIEGSGTEVGFKTGVKRKALVL